jgi:hypothetical protein
VPLTGVEKGVLWAVSGSPQGVLCLGDCESVFDSVSVNIEG